MTTRLVLFAQGSTAAARRGVFPADEPLDDQTSAVLAGCDVSRWTGQEGFVSPMMAARQTAEGLGIRTSIDLGLCDANSGHWAGRTIAEIAAEHPIDLAQWIADPGFDGHGGESRTALRNRVGRWLVAHAGAGPVLAVTHVAVIRAMILTVLEAPDEAFWRLDVGPLTITDLRHDGRRWTLRGIGLPSIA